MPISHSSMGRFFSHGLAMERTLHIDFSETIFDLEDVYFETLHRIISTFKDHYAAHDLIIHKHYYKTEPEIKAHLCVQLITSELRFFENFRIELYDKKRSVIEAYKSAFTLTSGTFSCEQLDILISEGHSDKFQAMLKDFYDKSIAYFEREIMHEIIKKFQKPCIITIEKLKLEHLFDIPRSVKGIVFKEFISKSKVDLRFTNIFDIPVVQYNFDKEKVFRLALSSYDDGVVENPKRDFIRAFMCQYQLHQHMHIENYNVKHDGIRIYAQCANQNNIEHFISNTMYEAIGVYQTEYDYLTFNMAMSEEFMADRYREIIKKVRAVDKEIIISLADIRSDKGFNMPNNITLDLIDCHDYPGMFQSQIKAIAQASAGYEKVSIVVPMIYEASEISDWQSIIQFHFNQSNNQSPKIGFFFETESMFDYMEDLLKVQFDFAVLGFNDLFSQLHDIDPYDKVDIKKFKTHYYEELRDVHSILKKMNIRHLCMGNVLSDSDILHKLMKMGFNDFSIIRNNEIKTYEILKLREKNKGRFIGEYARQIALRDYRRYILKTTGKKPPNRVLNGRKKKPKKDDEKDQ